MPAFPIALTIRDYRNHRHNENRYGFALGLPARLDKVLHSPANTLSAPLP